jgi:hypothetical protein
LVEELLGFRVRRKFLTCWPVKDALRLQNPPEELAAADVLPALAADGREIHGVAFICMPETSLSAIYG